MPPLSYMEKGAQYPAWCRTPNSPQASSTAHTNSRAPGPTRQMSLLDHGGLRTPVSSHLASVGVQEQVYRSSRRHSTEVPPTARRGWEPRAPRRPAQARTCPPRCPELSAKPRLPRPLSRLATPSGCGHIPRRSGLVHYKKSDTLRSWAAGPALPVLRPWPLPPTEGAVPAWASPCACPMVLGTRKVRRSRGNGRTSLLPE